MIHQFDKDRKDDDLIFIDGLKNNNYSTFK